MDAPCRRRRHEASAGRFDTTRQNATPIFLSLRASSQTGLKRCLNGSKIFGKRGADGLAEAKSRKNGEEILSFFRRRFAELRIYKANSKNSFQMEAIHFRVS
jgi:hypothetical protein